MVFVLCTPDGPCVDTISIVKFAKGYNSIKIYVEFWFLFFLFPLMMLYICTKFRGNISKGFRVIKWTRFP